MSIRKPADSRSRLEDIDQAQSVDVRRVRQAIETAKRSLASFPQTEDVRRLIRQAAGLSAEVDHWTSSPPTSEACDRVMRSVMAIHVGTVQVARAARAVGKA